MQTSRKNSIHFDVLVHTYGALYIGQQITPEERVVIGNS